MAGRQLADGCCAVGERLGSWRAAGGRLAGGWQANGEQLACACVQWGTGVCKPVPVVLLASPRASGKLLKIVELLVVPTVAILIVFKTGNHQSLWLCNYCNNIGRFWPLQLLVK